MALILVDQAHNSFPGFYCIDSLSPPLVHQAAALHPLFLLLLTLKIAFISHLWITPGPSPPPATRFFQLFLRYIFPPFFDT